jgi:hypothetical protein
MIFNKLQYKEIKYKNLILHCTYWIKEGRFADLDNEAIPPKCEFLSVEHKGVDIKELLQDLEHLTDINNILLTTKN